MGERLERFVRQSLWNAVRTLSRAVGTRNIPPLPTTIPTGGDPMRCSYTEHEMKGRVFFFVGDTHIVARVAQIGDLDAHIGAGTRRRNGGQIRRSVRRGDATADRRGDGGGGQRIGRRLQQLADS